VQAIGDVRLALEGAFDAPASSAEGGAVPRAPRPSWRLWHGALAAMLVVAGALAAWVLKPDPAGGPQPMRQFVLTPAPGPLAIANTNRDIQITPDGTRVIFFAGQGAERALYVWPLDALAPTVVRRGERLFDPFVSPDSKWVAFNDETDFALRKVPLTGGPPVTLASIGREIAGATWGPDGSIVFAFSGLASGLMRLPEGGGSPVALTTLDKARGEVGHYWPEFLSGGNGLIFTVRVGSRGAQSEIWAMDLRNGKAKRLVETGTGARYSGTGHLVYGADNALWAVAFDPATMEIRGEAVQVRDAVPAKSSGAVSFSVSADGSLAYVSAASAVALRRLVWIDRATGAREVASLPPRPYTTARISPDGSRVALDIRDEGGDIWIWDLARNIATKITYDPSSDATPAWTADGQRIVFQSQRGGVPNIFAQSADGTGAVERLTETANTQYPSAVLRDGSVLYWELGARSPLDVYMLPPAARTRVAVPLLQTAALERNPEPSPDGKWLAYGSNENQAVQQEIWVRPFPHVAAGRVQISSGGGLYPMWHPRTGAELFYMRPDGALVVVPMRDGAPAGTPRVVVDAGFYTAPNPRTFDLSPDGKRFLMIENLTADGDAAPSGIVVVLNWADELRRRRGPVR
jgi:Tol biopolymer transport system component